MYATPAKSVRRSRSRVSPSPSRPRSSQRRRGGPQKPKVAPQRQKPSKAQIQTLRRSSRRQALIARKQEQRLADIQRETLIKLSVNGILIAVSVGALAKLVPALWTQQSQLKEIRSELISTQTRVGRLRSDFNRTFDPMQGTAVMQQQSYRTDPNQKPIVWVEPGTSSGIQSPRD